MMKENVTKLYNFIAKLMTLLEEEIEILESSNNKNALIMKKNITETLTKLVHILAQLNKMSKEEHIDSEESLSCQDEEIINMFLSKYKHHSEN
ncbi:MAG: hypothetical protein KA998_01115 [Rickettsiaceae bacterium]|nr:hypothetical protein [Rickettsiaceae bacterium]